MAQSTYRVHLRASHFPLLSRDIGRTAIDRKGDDHNQVPKQFEGSEASLNLGTPQIAYLENVIPTAEGLTSVTYNTQAQALGDTIYPCEKDGAYVTNKGSLDNGVWKPYNFGGDVDVARLHGKTFVLSSQGISSCTGTATPLSDCLPRLLIGIVEVNNFLVTYSKDRLFWGSAVAGDETEFTPERSTLAGTSIPLDLKGDIVVVTPIQHGMLIYTTENVVYGRLSGGDGCIFSWEEVPNADGVLSKEHVAWINNNASQVAYTTTGLQEVAPGGAKNIFPSHSEFLQGQIIEDWEEQDSSPRDESHTWSSETQTFFNIAGYRIHRRVLDSPMEVKLNSFGNKYLAISYGEHKGSYEYILLYDYYLQRWGKLKISHQDVVYYNGELAVLSKGLVKEVVTRGVGDGIAILGRFQLTRARWCEIHMVSVEEVAKNKDNFNLLWYHTLDGRTDEYQTQPTQTIYRAGLAEYKMRITGQTHTLAILGDFRLSSINLTFIRRGLI